jgi:hypothetical protein
MVKSSHSRPEGHVLVPAAAIGSLSILLVAGLSILRILDRADQAVGKWIMQGKSPNFPKVLPEWAVWLAVVFFAYGLAIAILSVGGTWRRVVLWISTAVLVAAWAPVLVLAAHAPDIAAPLMAVIWSGVCALVYAENHQMACDKRVDLSEITDEAR